VLEVSVGSWKLCYRVTTPALPIHFFRHLRDVSFRRSCFRIYRWPCVRVAFFRTPAIYMSVINMHLTNKIAGSSCFIYQPWRLIVTYFCKRSITCHVTKTNMAEGIQKRLQSEIEKYKGAHKGNEVTFYTDTSDKQLYINGVPSGVRWPECSGVLRLKRAVVGGLFVPKTFRYQQRSTNFGLLVIFWALSWISPLRGFKIIRPKYGKIAHYVLTIMDIADVKIYTIIVPYSYSIHTHISSTIGFTNNSWAY